MKTLKPVDQETYERIGAAYAICSQYPDVFGDVTMKKFCSMFVDVIDEGEDEQEARMKVYASEMYRILSELNRDIDVYGVNEALGEAIYEVLEAINGGEPSDEQ